MRPTGDEIGNEANAANEPISPGGAAKVASSGASDATMGASSSTYATPDRWRATPAPCWRLRGTAPEDFVVKVDSTVFTAGRSSVSLASIRDTNGWGALYQYADAKDLRGKRIEFSADIRTEDVQREANLFVRADDGKGNTVALDTMWYSYTDDRTDDRLIIRAVTGNTDWTTKHIVIDIPTNAAVISYGVALAGPGKAWIDNASLELAAPDSRVTAFVRTAEMLRENGTLVPDQLLLAPANLDFEVDGFEGECERQAARGN
jgi:hypothetical protein